MWDVLPRRQCYFDDRAIIGVDLQPSSGKWTAHLHEHGRSGKVAAGRGYPNAENPGRPSPAPTPAWGSSGGAEIRTVAPYRAPTNNRLRPAPHFIGHTRL